MKGLEKVSSQIPTRNTSLERGDGKPLRFEDKRSPDFPSAFDAEAFLRDLSVAMDGSKLFKAGITKYGKYFQPGTAESDHFTESLRDAQAIAVTLENWNRMMGITNESQTVATIDAIIDKDNIKRTQMRFNEDGTYRAGSLTQTLVGDELKKLQSEMEESLISNDNESRNV